MSASEITEATAAIFEVKARIKGLEEKIGDQERSYPASVRPAEVTVELEQLRTRVNILEELVELRKYKIFVLTKGGFIEMENSATENKLYRGITLYTPRGRDGYRQRDLKLTTRKQLAAKLRAKGDDLVAVVESMPQQLLGPEYEDAQDVDVVELADGMQLAVVVDAERTPLDKLVERVYDVEDMATEHAGWQRGRIRADETRSREWAVQHLIQTGHKGVRPYCYKKITLKEDGKTAGQIEIDGMAVSETAVVLVERINRVRTRSQ